MDNSRLIASLLDRESRHYDRHTQILSNIYLRILDNDSKERDFRSREKATGRAMNQSKFSNAMTALALGLSSNKGIANVARGDYSNYNATQQQVLNFRDRIVDSIKEETDPMTRESMITTYNSFITNKDFFEEVDEPTVNQVEPVIPQTIKEKEVGNLRSSEYQAMYDAYMLKGEK